MSYYFWLGRDAHLAREWAADFASCRPNAASVFDFDQYTWVQTQSADEWRRETPVRF